MKLAEILSQSQKRLKKSGQPDWLYDSQALVASILKINRLEINLHHNRVIKKDELHQIKEAIQRRETNEPISYILGFHHFFGRSFFVDESVLIPRAETEILIQKILDDNSQKKELEVLDIGTGSGIIAITLALEIDKSLCLGVDISGQALEVAQKNAQSLGANVKFLKSDVFANVSGRFDVIASNPPYIPFSEYGKLSRQIVDYEPKVALLAGENGLVFYSRIFQKAKTYLKKGGVVYVEVGYNQAEAVKKIALKSGFKQIEFIEDLQGILRVVKIF